MEKKNIICLSWCDADNVVNYGQILQACAMMYILRTLTTGKIIYLSYFPRNIKQKIKYYIWHYNFINGHLQSYLKTKKIIYSFIKNNNIVFYQIASYERANILSKQADVLVCGSDQIWHPQNYDKGFFLDFDNVNSKKISYAASLPKTSIEPQFIGEMKHIADKLKKFEYISVRERGSIDFISSLSGKNIEFVLDPTYLVPVEIWTSYLEKIVVPNRYIFVYVPNGMDKHMAEYIQILMNKTGIDKLKILVTRGDNLFEKHEKMKYVTIGQFLYLIKNAAYIFTSSFHAVVFSTIFQREFFCYDVPNILRGEDIRLKDILNTLGLEEKLITDNGNLNIKRIDYELVNKRIEKMKVKSLDFLKNI